MSGTRLSEIEDAINQYQQRKQRGRPRIKTGLIHPEVRSIYVPDELQIVWVKFQEIAKREGRTVSEMVVEYICDYVRHHELGNPQQTLTYLLEHEKPYRANAHKCYCGEKAEYEVLSLEKKQFYLCESHFIQNRDARLLRKWRKLK